MKRKWLLIGISIISVVLLILTSLTNAIGYRTVQVSNQAGINNEINQKELLSQIIVDFSNNKEIQRIILKSQISRGIFPVSNIPILTKNQLKQIYVIGLILSKVVSKSRIHSMVQQYQSINPQIQKEITSVIEKDASLNEEIIQLSALNCDCDNSNYKEKGIPMRLCETLLFIALVLVAPVDFLSLLFENMPLIRLIIVITIGWPIALISICIIFLMVLLNCWGNIPIPTY